MKKESQISLKLPIFLIIGPALGVILAIILYAIINFVLASTTPDVSPLTTNTEGTNITQSSDGSSSLYGNGGVSIFKTITNMFLFLLGAGSVVALVPCLVVGLVILNQRRAKYSKRVPQTGSQSPRDWGDLE